MYYYKARYYDPETGRFLQTDPIGYADQMNLYAYVSNDPINMLDPTGEVAIVAAIPWVVGAVACYFTCDDMVEAATGQSDGTVVGDTVATSAAEAIGDVVNNIKDGATPGRETKGRTKQYDKPGGMAEADGDFDGEVDPDSVIDRGDGVRTGTTPDGRKINVRPTSSDGRPTVEIQDGKNREKYRYGDPPPPPQEEIDE